MLTQPVGLLGTKGDNLKVKILAGLLTLAYPFFVMKRNQNSIKFYTGIMHRSKPG